MKISYGITVHNEADELNRLLEILIHKTDPDDEIVICVDGDDDGVEFVLQSWTQQLSIYNKSLISSHMTLEAKIQCVYEEIIKKDKMI